MRKRTKTNKETYWVYDCPICGKETRSYFNVPRPEDEQKPCGKCFQELKALKTYADYKYLIGAKVTGIKVSTYDLDSFYITKGNKVFQVSVKQGWDEGKSDLFIGEVIDAKD